MGQLITTLCCEAFVCEIVQLRCYVVSVVRIRFSFVWDKRIVRQGAGYDLLFEVKGIVFMRKLILEGLNLLQVLIFGIKKYVYKRGKEFSLPLFV